MYFTQAEKFELLLMLDTALLNYDGHSNTAVRAERLCNVVDIFDDFVSKKNPLRVSDYLDKRPPLTYNEMINTPEALWINENAYRFVENGRLTRKIRLIKDFRDKFRYNLVSSKAWVEAVTDTMYFGTTPEPPF